MGISQRHRFTWTALAVCLLLATGIPAVRGAPIAAPAPADEASRHCFTIGGAYNPRKRVQVCRRFIAPQKIVADAHGNLYVLDAGGGFGISGHITKLSPSGRPLAKWGTERWVWDPQSLTVDPYGKLYILGADLLELSSAGRDIAHWDLGAVRGLRGWLPTDLAVDSRGTVYLTGVDAMTQGRRFVAKLAPSRSGLSRTWTLKGGRLRLLALWTGYEPRSSIPPRNGGYPTIAVDSQRFIYVTEFGGLRPTMPGGSIYKLSSGGRRLAAWRIGGVVSAVAVDPRGNLYVAEGMRIQKFSPPGRPLTVYGKGMTGIRSVAVNGQDDIFAIGTFRVYKFSPQGKLLATWT